MRIKENCPHIALAGNPNCGKSTIFNALTGLRQKVANYPGVTVEKKEGEMRLPRAGIVHVIDLPGTYSLTPRSLDEEVTHDILLGLREDTPVPDVVVAVVDASNLERNLFFASQIMGIGKPVVIALNMMDLSRSKGISLDVETLQRKLGVPVVPMSANRGQGLSELKAAIETQLSASPPSSDSVMELNLNVNGASASIESIADALIKNSATTRRAAKGEALRVLSSDRVLKHPRYQKLGAEFTRKVEEARVSLGKRWQGFEAETRYAWIESVLENVRTQRQISQSTSDKIDAVLTHKFYGPFFLAGLLLLVFTSIYKFAEKPMDAISGVMDWSAKTLGAQMAEGPLRSLLTDGIIAGVGNILVFLPQIMILFLFIAILEDSGYMSRAAFLMDRIMGRVGLHGKAFIPLLSSFACAIPGVMAARTIENTRDRMVTILVAPLICCAARWPVYILLAGAFIPHRSVLGIPLPALTIFFLVMLGVVAAVLVAGILKRTLFKGETPALLLELPPYRSPSLKLVLRTMIERGWLFVKNAGTVILAISIILWALASYPKNEELGLETQVKNSYAGQLGQAIEPVIEPLGFDWKIGIALITSFAAREVFVSSMGTIYGLEVEDTAETIELRERLKAETVPGTEKPFYTPLRALSIMVFYVLAMQCMSTVAVVKRETGGWKWPIFQFAYMSALAWLASFAVWQGGRLLGFE
jgi:ferrous iron transport protein B